MTTLALQAGLAPVRRADHWRPAELVFWLLPVAAYFIFPDNLVLLTQIAITALFCLSLDLILGYAGIVSLGHAAFFGLGAYAAGLLAAHGFGDPLLGLGVAAVVAAALGFVTSLLVLRGADLTRLMVTLGVAMMLYELANKLTPITGGVDGLQGIEVLPLLGPFEFDLYGKTAFWYALAVLFVLFWVARRIVHSPFGLSLKGIRLNVGRMPALGTPVNARLAAVYTLGAAYAGIAGALLAQTTQFVALDVLSFNRSAELLLILVLGGSGSLYGALIGTIVFMSAHHLLSELNPQYWQFWLGALLVVIVLFARDGVMGGLRRIGARFGANGGTK
ncbi:branched-chain amino acid ABC transporter permease [Aromatoleum diolicum]|uniref:Branched-chain amino acid ABC transporter permease n=1 Tax=Aromatoleum diolicum TaxID=75796 RepID=A0ABX1Q8F0_9RHOO|nr:branched-chain amino acid ABC transporter permease [Aromatoleum diolicum]NMG73454.1 branched-chain amino acid ABC transporter permease [Aromatoleum diolicum]